MDVLDPQFLGQPGGDLFAGPQATVRCGIVQGRSEFLADIRRYEGSLPRVLVATVADPIGQGNRI